MATFRIHEDLEKENRSHKITTNAIASKQNEKRSATVFGILDNKISKNIPRIEKQIVGKYNDENVYNKNVLSKPTGKIEPKVAAESYKFSVYEDIDSDNPEDKENITSTEESSSSSATSSSTLRNPLSELKHGISTPMSVGECLTPMSVDKSILNESTQLMISTPRNERDTFFEIKEYQADILCYLKEAETRNRPKHGYMKKQPDITPAMRTILVDWLSEVCEEYKLQSETFCLAISYIDRFLSFMSVVRAKLQLVGTAAMLIAAKYEEIYPPDVAEFVYITDDTYAKNQVLRMEQLILKVLSFDLTIPTVVVFVNLFAVMLNFPEKIKHLTQYLCELSLLEADPYLQFIPSKITSAALALSRHMLNLPIWPKQYEEVIGYKLTDLIDIILHLNQTHIRSTKMVQQAIQEKYKSSKFMEVSTINPCDLDKYTMDILVNKQSPEFSAEGDSYESQENNEDVRKMISRIVV